MKPILLSAWVFMAVLTAAVQSMAAAIGDGAAPAAKASAKPAKPAPRRR